MTKKIKILCTLEPSSLNKKFFDWKIPQEWEINDS